MYINLLIKIKNAGQAGKKTIKTDYTKFDESVLQALKRAQFILKCEVKGRAHKRFIEVELNDAKLIRDVNFLSTPSKKVFSGYKELRPVKGGYGQIVMTTSRGVMTGNEARKNRIGGQKLFEIW